MSDARPPAKHSRRRFLGLTSAGVAGALLAACAQQAATPTTAPAATSAPAQATKPAVGATAAPAATSVVGTTPAPGAATAAATTPAAATTAAPGATSAPAQATKPAAAATPAPAAQPAASKATGTLKYRSWWNPAQGPTYQGWDEYIKTEFPARNQGVSLQMEYVPFADYWKKFLTSVAGGDVPDVMHTSCVWARDLYDLGTLTELNDYIRATPDMDPSKLLPFAVQFATAGGKIFGAPWEGPDGSGGLFYNTRLFKEAGIDPTYEKVKAWTWDDFDANAKKLTKRNGDTVDVAGFLVHVLDVGVLNAWVHTIGGKFYKDDTQQQAAFADEGKGAKVVQHYLDLLNTHKVSHPLAQDRQDRQLFLTEKTAMYVTNIYSVANNHADVPSLQFDMVPLPKGPDGTGPAVASFANPHTIPAASKNKDSAWAFTSWYCSLESSLAKLRIMKRHSVRKDFYDTKEWKEESAAWPPLEHMIDASQASTATLPTKRWQRINDIWTSSMQGMLLGQTPPSQGITDLQMKVSEILVKPPEG